VGTRGQKRNTEYGKYKATISEHIKHIFEEGELDENVVVRKFRTTTPHGAIENKEQVHETNFYNLDVISEWENQ
jgi:hypothetical protein